MGGARETQGDGLTGRQCQPLPAQRDQLGSNPVDQFGRAPGLRGLCQDLLVTNDGERLDTAARLLVDRLGTDTIVAALLDTLLLYIMRAWFDEHPKGSTNTGWAAALADPAISAALHSIHRDPARPWTVANVAAEAGLSRAAFSKRFTTMIGQPPLTYLTWWRMTTAARLLHASDTPLGQIAAQTGYTSEFAFANAFKREFGTAPGRYRQARTRNEGQLPA
ncbi:AraC-like DNA-binding protein [Nocardia sp. GAS34]|uniref:helix-turn-helix transcriptional regulator n=1 Tax=unclassified Nocardia TaxID=2637762 RepID=UPI003D1BD7F5